VNDLPALSAQQNMQLPIAKTTALAGELDDPFALIQHLPLERLVLPRRERLRPANQQAPRYDTSYAATMCDTTFRITAGHITFAKRHP
tara:strand:- start:12 stop:275 length:264 start_codon:yes stop_codon:yes gene_type:complete